MKKNSGLTYIEVMAGIGIILFLLVGMNGIFGVGVTNNKKAENMYIALNMAQGTMEQVMSKDYSAIAPVSGNLNGFQYKVEVVEDTNIKSKLVTVTVSGTGISDVKLYYLAVDLALPLPPKIGI